MQLPKLTGLKPVRMATAPCTTEFELNNEAGEAYLIQVAWPLAWEADTTNRPAVPIFYILDGNAHFWSAVETIRRGLAVATSKDAVVVGIGYPDCGHYVFANRRSYDLTPPTKTYVPPKYWDGRVYPAAHGGADELLAFIQDTVRPYVLGTVLQSLRPECEVLVGHSYGGLCTLHALFSGKTVFDTFIALSPSIWWSDSYLLQEEHDFMASSRDQAQNCALKVYLSYGYYEQYIRRRKDYSDKEYAQRAAYALGLRTNDLIDGMAARLSKSDRFELVKRKVYMDEDHGSVAGCSLGWAMSDVLDPDRFA